MLLNLQHRMLQAQQQQICPRCGPLAVRLRGQLLVHAVGSSSGSNVHAATASSSSVQAATRGRRTAGAASGIPPHNSGAETAKPVEGDGAGGSDSLRVRPPQPSGEAPAAAAPLDDPSLFRPPPTSFTRGQFYVPNAVVRQLLGEEMAAAGLQEGQPGVRVVVEVERGSGGNEEVSVIPPGWALLQSYKRAAGVEWRANGLAGWCRTSSATEATRVRVRLPEPGEDDPATAAAADDPELIRPKIYSIPLGHLEVPDAVVQRLLGEEVAAAGLLEGEPGVRVVVQVACSGGEVGLPVIGWASLRSYKSGRKAKWRATGLTAWYRTVGATVRTCVRVRLPEAEEEDPAAAAATADPDVVRLTPATIAAGDLYVPRPLVRRLLGVERVAAGLPEDHPGVPVVLEAEHIGEGEGPERQTVLPTMLVVVRSYMHGIQVEWRAKGLAKWFRTIGATASTHVRVRLPERGGEAAAAAVVADQGLFSLSRTVISVGIRRVPIAIVRRLLGEETTAAGLPEGHPGVRVVLELERSGGEDGEGEQTAPPRRMAVLRSHMQGAYTVWRANSGTGWLKACNAVVGDCIRMRLPRPEEEGTAATDAAAGLVLLTEWSIAAGQLYVPLSLVRQRLGEEVAVAGPSDSQPGVHVVLELERSGGDEAGQPAPPPLTTLLRFCKGRTRTKWMATDIRRWYLAGSAMAGDSVRVRLLEAGGGGGCGSPYSSGYFGGRPD